MIEHVWYDAILDLIVVYGPVSHKILKEIYAGSNEYTYLGVL